MGIWFEILVVMCCKVLFRVSCVIGVLVGKVLSRCEGKVVESMMKWLWFFLLWISCLNVCVSCVWMMLLL